MFLCRVKQTGIWLKVTQTKMNDLPIYEITLNDYDVGVYAISLVENPAIESNFIFMDKDVAPTFYVSDEDKREILGAVLVPDKLIYRVGEDGKEFYVRFSKEVIADINERVHKYDFDANFTIDHSLTVRNGISYLESWIKETDNDKSVAFGIDEPIGTLFFKLKVENDLVWDLVKEGKLKGFSVELDASLTRVEFNKPKEKEKKTMDYTKLFPNTVETEDGTLRFVNTDVGSPVLLEKVVTEDEKEETTYDEFTGEFEHEGFTVKVVDGNITEKNEIVDEEEGENKDTNSFSIDDFVEAVNTAIDKRFSEIEEKLTALSEKTNDVASKVSETKLEMKQMLIDEHKEENEDVEGKEEFDVNVYRAISKWSR